MESIITIVIVTVFKAAEPASGTHSSDSRWSLKKIKRDKNALFWNKKEGGKWLFTVSKKMEGAGI